MTPLASLTVEQEPPVTVLRLAGELDMSNAAQLEQAARDATAEAAGVVLDLTEVTFLDSAGVRLLDHLVAAWAPPERLRVVVAEEGPVRFTLRLCGFPEALLCASRGEARAAVAPPG